MVQRILIELRYFLYEFAALIAVSGTFMIIDYFFTKQFTHSDNIWKNEYSYLSALNENLLTWNSIFTIFALVLIFFLFRDLGEERAGFLEHKIRSRLLAPLRDYLAVVIFSFTAATFANLSVVGTYRVPTGLLVGLVMWWMIPVMLFKAGGLIRPTRATLIEIAVVFGLMAIGWILPPAIAGSLSAQNFGYYLVSVTILYTLGFGVAVLAYPHNNLAVTVNNRLVAYLIWLLLFFIGILFIIASVLVMSAMIVFCLPVFAVIKYIQGISFSMEEILSQIVETLCLYETGSKNLAVILSPFRLIKIYLIDIISNLAQGSFKAICEALSFLVSIHFITYMYRPDQQSRHRTSLTNTEKQG